MALQEIKYGSEASSALLNDNFNYLHNEIVETNTTLNTAQNNLTGKISILESSISSQLATFQEQLNSQINEVTDSMFDFTSKISSVLSNIAPDYSKGISILNGWSAISAGWIIFCCNSSANFTSVVKVNNVIVGRDYQISGDGRAGTHHYYGMAFVSKGDIVTFSQSTVTFCPCKGVS